MRARRSASAIVETPIGTETVHDREKNARYRVLPEKSSAREKATARGGALLASAASSGWVMRLDG